MLAPFWPPKWHPGSAPIVGKSAPGRSKTVPRSSWFGPFFVLSFGIAFLVVLGSSWGRFWSSWAPLRVVFGRSGGRFGAFFGISTHRFNPSTHQLVDATHQLINLSTHQPMALRHFLTRPGGLRAARLNLPSCERKAEYSNAFRYIKAFLYVFFRSIFLQNMCCKKTSHCSKNMLDASGKQTYLMRRLQTLIVI